MQIPFFGSPLPLPRRDFLSSSLLLGLVGGAVCPRTPSPLSLSESPRPESREEFFLSRRLALALSLASWMVEVGAEIQLPLISLSILLVGPFSSSPDRKESLRSSVGTQIITCIFLMQAYVIFKHHINRSTDISNNCNNNNNNNKNGKSRTKALLSFAV